MFIRDVIRDREPYSLRTSASVLEAARFMYERRIGAVCVLDDEGKLIGVLTNSGGISNEFVRVAEMVKKETGSILIADDEPEKLVDRCLDLYTRAEIPTSIAFSRHAEFPLRRPVITQETRG